MSKNISIQENGVSKTLNTISRVVTNGLRHGSVNWVPEDEVTLGIITISENGEYKASDEGYYAFSETTVYASGKATGIDPDTGEWETVMTDDDGMLIEMGLPERIEVTTPPDKLDYVTGQPIDKKGMVVTAYFDDDTEWGVVPNEEIELDPMIAVPSGGEHYEKKTDFSDIPRREFQCWANFTQYLESPVPSASGFSWTWDNRINPSEETTLFDDSHQRSFILKHTNYKEYLAVIVSDTNSCRIRRNGSTETISISDTYKRTLPNGEEYWRYSYWVTDNDGYNTVHTPNMGQEVSTSVDFNSSSSNQWYDEALILWGGEYIDGAEVEVAVKWKRDGDEQELTSSFKVIAKGLLE